MMVFPQLHQPKNGYRYNIDSFLLARFANLKKSERVCDLGAGVGILGILALQRYHVQHVTAVELQKELAEYAEKNRTESGLEKKMAVLHCDWRNLTRQKTRRRFDVVIANPPYRAARSGRLPKDNSKAVAKHETHGDMKSLINVSKKILKPEGRLILLYPVDRLEELLQNLHRARLKGQRMRFIHPYGDRPPTHLMVEAVPAPRRELQVEAPLIVYRDPEHYTAEVEQWVGKKRRR